jgi:hypothetical protein
MQIVPNGFNELAQGDVRPHSWGALISFSKMYDEDIEFFTLNESTLNGEDILGTSEDNPLQAWDYYEYNDYSERITGFTIERTIDFPYSVVNAIADFTLNNYDKYFTPNSSSPISSYIRPKRPVRLLQGLSNTLLPQFVGLTQGMPEISETEATATLTAVDFLTQIFDMPIRDTVAMQNVTTDEVLANIFEQFGLTSSQYDLGKGRNVIKFLFFEKDQLTAGDVIRPMMQAEGGKLWLSEEGIIRFLPRLELPSEPVYTFDADSIISCDVVNEDQIINHVIINTDVREVQEYQTIYSKRTNDSTLDIVPAGGTYTFVAQLQDPQLTVETPVYGQNSDVSWFTAAQTSGELVSTGISVVSTVLKTNTYEVTISNSNTFPVNINQMNLWGQPAKRISVEPIVYENRDLDSIEIYEDNKLEISSNFIQDIDEARSLSLSILDDYSQYADIIEMEVKGNPALQSYDVVNVDYNQFVGQYRIIGMRNSLQNAKFTQILTARRYTPRTYFQLNVSALNSTDVLAP